MLATVLDQPLHELTHTTSPTLGAPVRADSRPTCFLHIPKSAGSSIHAALEAALPLGSLAPQRVDSSLFCDFDDFELLRPEARSQVAACPREVQALARYRAVSGHFSLTTLLRIADASSICTVLREPRARLLSLYMYWRTPGTSDFWAPYPAADHAQRPLWEFLSEPLLAPAIDNQICRMLLYGDPRLPESEFAAPSDIEAIAADAIKRLDALGFVGVLELGDSVWQGLARLFDVKLSPTRLNVTEDLGNPTATRPGGRLLTAEALDLVGRRSAADLVVYDHALTRAHVDACERRRLGDGAFARQLVKLGDLVGNSAGRAAAQAVVVEELQSQLKERDRLQVELDTIRGRLHMRECEVRGLEDEVRRRDENMAKLSRRLESMHASASWRLTTPLRTAKHAVRRLQPARRSTSPPLQP
jgi:hypothetical protein